MRLTFLGLAVLSLTAQASAENVKQSLLKAYGTVTKAMQTHDLGSLKGVLAADYHATTESGKSIGRDEIIRQFTFQSNSLTHLKWPRTILELHVTGGVALATVSGHLAADTKGQTPHRLELIATTKDTWKKIGSQWELTGSKLIQSKMTLDGKPMNMGVR